MKTINWLALLGSAAALTLTGCPDNDDADGGAGGTADAGTETTATVDEGVDDGAVATGGTAAADSGSSGCLDAGCASSDGGTTMADDDAGATMGDASDSGTAGQDGSGSDGEASGSDDGDKVENCEAPGDLISCDAWGDDVQWYQVLGLGCEGSANEVIPIQGEGFNAPDGTGWSLATRFGTHEQMPGEFLWTPREGEQMLMLSTGQGGVPDANGVVEFDDLEADDNGNPSDKPLPAPMSPQPGSGGAPFTGCDGVNDCSDSLINQWVAGGMAANDLVWMQFAAEVPAGTHGFAVDFAYFSEEFPEWVGSEFNDMFVVWSNSETYTGNLCFINDQPCTVTALFPTTYQAGDTELAQTGFTEDGATDWFQIKGSAEPGELLELTLAVFDMGDEEFDTLVLIDNFAWDCEGCMPSEINPCGVVDPT